MRGKRAKELRKAARMIQGPDALVRDYGYLQQRDRLGRLLAVKFERRVLKETVRGMYLKLKASFRKVRRSATPEKAWLR